MGSQDHLLALSVVLPVRNGQNFIATAISSVLRQSFADFELLVVNDGSTDLTESIVRSFQDPRVHLLSNIDKPGIVGALNLGIRSARGKYIARIDHDDIALPDRFEKQYAILSSQPEIGLVGSWARVFGDKNYVLKVPSRGPEILFEMLFRNPILHPTVMFRKLWDQGSRGYYADEYALAEDFEMWTRLAVQWEILNLPEALTMYRSHENQVTQHKQYEREKCSQRIIELQMENLGFPLTTKAPLFFEEAKWWGSFFESLKGRTAYKGANFEARRRQLLLSSVNRRVVRKFEAIIPGLRSRKLLEVT